MDSKKFNTQCLPPIPADKKGIFSRPNEPGDWVYIYPIRIYSKDSDNPNYRFGVVSFFIKNKNEWLAVTVRQIFLKSWTPNNITSVLGSKEPIIGKDAFTFEWTSEITKDISEDSKIFTDNGHFGKIIKELDPVTVLIKVDDMIINTETFKNEGFWAQIAS